MLQHEQLCTGTHLLLRKAEQEAQIPFRKCTSLKIFRLEEASGDGSSKLWSKQGHIKLCRDSSGWAAGICVGEGPTACWGNLVRKVTTLTWKIFFFPLASNWNISCCFFCQLPLVFLLCFSKKSLGEGEEKIQVTSTFSSFMVWWLYTSAGAFGQGIAATNSGCAVLLSRGKRNSATSSLSYGVWSGELYGRAVFYAPVASSYHLSQQKGCRNIKYYFGRAFPAFGYQASCR